MKMNADIVSNKELNDREIGESRTFLESKPQRLMILLTTKCNLRCIMCHRATRESLTVPFDAIKKIYDLLPHITWINWQGGEVFLVDYFRELFLKISAFEHIYQTVLTSGILVDEDWANLLSEFNVGVTYSIDAVRKGTYEKIRKGAKFSNLLESCERMRKYREKYGSSTPLEITAVVMRSNYRELYLFPEFCRKYGFSNLRFDYLHPGMAPEEDVILRRVPDAVEYMTRALPEIEMKCRELNVGFDCTFREFLDGTPAENGQRSEMRAGGTIRCKLPWQQFTIIASEKGDVQPDCACIHPVGNLTDSTAEQIWNSKKMQSYRHNLITGNIKHWCAKKCLIDMGCGWNG